MAVNLEEAATRPRRMGRPKKPEGNGVQIRHRRSIVSKAKYLAEHKDMQPGDYLDAILGPILDREFRKLGRGFLRELEEQEQ